MITKRAMWMTVCAAGLAVCGGASADIIESQNFEGDPSGGFGGWMVNGNQMTFDFGHPGYCMGVPYLDFWGITLSNSEPACALVGDVTRHGAPLRVGADVQVLALDNFFNEPMDPSDWPIVLELVDYGDPNDPNAFPVSVYTIGPGMPRQDQGWGHVDFVIPDPTSEVLPSGWHGTGDYDPVTYEPLLPPGRTYRNVLESVDEIRITTMVPGFLYGSSFWQAAFDNVYVQTLTGQECPPDYNHDGFIDPLDYNAFINDFEAGYIAADYNGDGFLDPLDYNGFINAFEAGC